MQIYPFTSPIILTDDIFVEYGGLTGSSVPAQRQSAYWIAEARASSYLGTLLLPHIVTGAVSYSPYSTDKYVSTEMGYVHEILGIRILEGDGSLLYAITGSNTAYATISDDSYGYLFIHDAVNKCLTPDNRRPIKVEYSYLCGLPTGVASNQASLLALTTAAQIVLNEITGNAENESTGDAGVIEFESLEYREKRKGWKNTVFGQSPKAAFVASLFDGIIKKARKALML